jgi:hypothetical protein
MVGAVLGGVAVAVMSAMVTLQGLSDRQLALRR